MTAMNTPNARLSLIALFSVFAFVLFSVVASAQGQTPKRGAQLGSSYSVGQIDAVNTTNGNVMLRLPLAKLPAGRGGMSAGVTLVYNSKLWDTRTQYVDDPNGTLGVSYPYSIVEASNDGGWKMATRYTLELVERPHPYVTAGPCGPYSYGDPEGPPSPVGYADPDGYYRFKLKVHFPDGSSREFAPYGYPTNGEGWGYVHPNGSQASCTSPGASYTGPGATFLSTDGTYTRLVIPATTTAGGWMNNWTMYMADGSRIESTNLTTPSGYQRVYDRNGNYIQDGVLDSVGRQITFGNNGPNQTTISQTGYNNETLTWTLNWKTIWVYKRYKAYTDLLPSNMLDQGWRELYTSLSVLDSVTMPSQIGGGVMKFYYDAGTQQPASGQYTTGWGNLVGYTLPCDPLKEPEMTPWNGSSDTRPKVQFAYTTDDVQASNQTFEDFTTYLRAKSKTLTYRRGHDGSTATDTWTYNIDDYTGYSSVGGPGGSVTQEYFIPTSQGKMGGTVYKTVNPDGSVVERLWAQNPISSQFTVYATYNPYVKTEFVSIPNAAGTLVSTAIKDYVYDQNGNVRFVTEYDFVSYSSVPRGQNGRPTGIPAGATPVRTTETNYHVVAPFSTGGSYTTLSNFYGHPNAPRVISAPINTRLRIGGQTGAIISASEITYDNPLTTANPVTTRAWDSTKGAWTSPLTTSNSNAVQTQYDIYGNPTLITDARGVQTFIEYGQVGNVTGLYPTMSHAAYGTSLQRNSTTAYDFATGLAMWTRDDDNQVTTTMDYDGAGRPTAETTGIASVVPSQQAKTTIQYFDADRYVVSRSDIGTFGDGRSVSIAHFDQLGRTWLIRTLEDPTQSTTDITFGIKVQTRWENETGSGANGSRMLVSNPYRAATPTAATNEPGMGWSLSRADKAGKILWVQTFAGAALPAPWGANSTSTGTVTTAYDANATTVTDQSGKVRRSITDGFGRLLRVDEPNASNQLGTVAAPNQATSYVYDIRDNLLQVNQGVQTRSFVYDSLSRLTSATAPESGTTSYTYDAGGNLLTKTDARGVVVTNTYDALNRPTQRSYALTANVGATSTANYYYDGAGLTGITPNFVKGKLTKVTNGSASYEYRDFDALGRVLSARQIIDGNNYDTSYTYNLAGALITETYPTGRTVTNTYNADGSLTGVSGRAAGQAVRSYASNFEYAAHGAATKFQYGSGLWEETAFNSRLQVTGITLRKQANTLWNAAYDYGTTDNNGNVKSQNILHPGITQPLVQTYSYDSLNRLTQVVENHNAIEQWKQTFTYDRYGNRTVVTGQTTPSMVGPNPVINQANNRITPQVAEGYAFDTAGNMTFDKDGRKFVFDAENKVISFFQNQTNQTPTAEYRYDADGKRVKKIVGNVTTLFVYDAMGKMIAEYAINELTPAPRTQYLTADTLSSQRVISDGQGTITSRRDFAPFGEELPSNPTNRQTSVGYASANDKTKQKFATYERDDESGFDFAETRNFLSTQGRFTSADLQFADQHVFDPQSWNLYLYGRNNPLKFIDPTGREIWIIFEEDGPKGQKILNRVRYKNGKVFDKNNKEYTGGNSYVVSVVADLNQLKKDDPILEARISVLEESKYEHKIQKVDDGKGSSSYPDSARNEHNGIPTGSTTKYDPTERKSATGDERTPRVALAHELLGHGYDDDQGETDDFMIPRENALDLPMSEVNAVRIENLVRAVTGDPLRTQYENAPIPPELLNRPKTSLMPKQKKKVN